jgi:hypothetical protein
VEIDKPAALAAHGVFSQLGNIGFSAIGAKFKLGVTEQFSFPLDGLVKSPSVLLGAGLRCNPAPLDKKLHSWDAGMKLLIFEGKSLFEKYLTG